MEVVADDIARQWSPSSTQQYSDPFSALYYITVLLVQMQFYSNLESDKTSAM